MKTIVFTTVFIQFGGHFKCTATKIRVYYVNIFVIDKFQVNRINCLSLWLTAYCWCLRNSNNFAYHNVRFNMLIVCLVSLRPNQTVSILLYSTYVSIIEIYVWPEYYFKCSFTVTWIVYVSFFFLKLLNNGLYIFVAPITSANESARCISSECQSMIFRHISHSEKDGICNVTSRY